MAKKEFELIEEAIPGRARAGGSFYMDVLHEFVESGKDEVRVKAQQKPATLLQGLMKAAKGFPVKAVKRGDNVYLKRVNE